MVVGHLNIYETEQGDPVALNGTEIDGVTVADLSWGVEADSTIEFKEQGKDIVILTLTGTTDFTFANPTITWTPTDTHLNTLTVNKTYDCFVHARNNATPRERVLKFTLTLLNS
jgi:hypothetical protein